MNIEQDIKMLEEKLLSSDFNLHPELIDQLLSKDFEELGSNGKFASRDQVVHWLKNKNYDCQWELAEFRIIQVSSEVVLSLYKANKIENGKVIPAGSTRSSVWRREDGYWKMIFHQSSKLES